MSLPVHLRKQSWLARSCGSHVILRAFPKRPKPHQSSTRTATAANNTLCECYQENRKPSYERQNDLIFLGPDQPIVTHLGRPAPHFCHANSMPPSQGPQGTGVRLRVGWPCPAAPRSIGGSTPCLDLAPPAAKTHFFLCFTLPSKPLRSPCRIFSFSASPTTSSSAPSLYNELHTLPRLHRTVLMTGCHLPPDSRMTPFLSVLATQRPGISGLQARLRGALVSN
jgi:hypothetical protein